MHCARRRKQGLVTVLPIPLLLKQGVPGLTQGRHRGEALSDEITSFKPTVILAADCVYFEPAFPLLLRTLTDLLQLSPSATIYFCFKKRRRADMQFLAKATKKFDVAEVEDADRPVFSRQGLFLYTIRSKGASTDKNGGIGSSM